MKTFAISFILFFAATFSSIAQNYQEIVHLTDGSIIKGIILEQVPNDYLTIETASGRVYTIEMYEVEKITKERSRTNTPSNNRSTQSVNRQQYSNNQYNYPNNRGRRQNNYSNNRTSTQRQSYYYDDDYYDDDYYDDGRDYSYFPNRGYKGFIDLGFSFGTSSNIEIGNQSEKYNKGDNRLEFSTSHGIFFNPYIFAGLGAGIHFYTGYNDDDGEYQSYDEVGYVIPIFAHVRSHFIDAKASPFVDVKLGYSVNDLKGTYFSPSVGCRFAKGSRSAFWIGMGYSLQKANENLIYYWGSGNSSRTKASATLNAFSLKIGWDF